MKAVTFDQFNLNFQPLPKGKLVYTIDWESKPHRNQFIKSGKTQIQIEIKEDIWISETLVTQQLWTEIMTINPSKFIGQKKPVENISYNEIELFLIKLNKIADANVRLMTESEFLYACALNYDKDFRNNIDNLVWYEKNSNNQTQNVGTNGIGNLNLYDLLGNLYHFVIADITNIEAQNCIYKGACYMTQDLWIDQDYTMTIKKNIRNSMIGFRLVAT